MKATVKDLRFHSRELLDTVSRGEEVIITFRGKLCVKLVPYQHAKNVKEGKLFDMWKENYEIENVEEYIRNIRKRKLYHDYRYGCSYLVHERK